MKKRVVSFMGVDNQIERADNFLRGVRHKLFLPILSALNKLKVTPNRITNLRFLMIILFVLLFGQYRQLSIALLTISLLLDLFDGALARHRKISSDRGKFLDVFVDSSSYIFVVVTFLHFEVNSFLVVANVVLFVYVFLFASIWKNEKVKSDWIMHPSPKSNYLVALPLLAFYLFHLFGVDYLELSLYVSTALILIAFVYYYVRLQMRWAKKN